MSKYKEKIKNAFDLILSFSVMLPAIFVLLFFIVRYFKESIQNKIVSKKEGDKGKKLIFKKKERKRLIKCFEYCQN